MKILYVSSEVVPFAKTGGLADVAGSLMPALAEGGAEASVFMPFYAGARRAAKDVSRTGVTFSIRVGRETFDAEVLKSQLPGADVTVYFLDAPALYDREGLYVSDGIPYPDNASRFIFFSRAVPEFIISAGLDVDIVHSNDWQSALVPVYLKTLYADNPRTSGICSVLTIHNMSYQGLFWHFDMELTGLDWSLFHWKRLEYYGKVNLLKGGIVFADAVTAVSERYAREIQTEEFGCGLEGVLAERTEDLAGILNGVDYAEWNPETDSYISANYSAADIAPKARCKSDLQKRTGLPEKADTPLIGMVTRIVEQKGIDLVADAFVKIMDLGVQMVILGTGEPGYELQLRDLAERYPDQAAVFIAYDNKLAHWIEAGADFFLMPSRFEPCGLNQMFSMKYGTVPIVRFTGGLADTVVDATSANVKQRKATGFVFKQATPGALARCVGRAVEMYNGDRESFVKLQSAGMAQDFSWKNSARKYMELYNRIKRKRVQPV
ncbi:MAG: glycogen synthase GlgA [Planctomycetota bacterium]|jgi:starch synthase